MDPYPIFEKSDTPYSIWGADPTDVDAPGRQGVKDYDWSARTFLTYTPDAAMTRHVVPILAFTWGFWLKNYKPYVKKLERLDVSCWNDHLQLFRSRFPDWTFDDSRG